MTLIELSRNYKEDLELGIAKLLIWKTGRNWNCYDLFDSESEEISEITDADDIAMIRKAYSEDAGAMLIDGYRFSGFYEGMTIRHCAEVIRWHYNEGCASKLARHI